MTEKKKEGILLVNKPGGMTSHDVVDVARRCLGIQRIGHAGTLDPLAEGLLILLVGRATKLFPRFVNFDKEYVGELKLGEVTTTGDSQGRVYERRAYETVTEEMIHKAGVHFKGEKQQVPPMVSALRVGGQRLYHLARRGISVKRAPRTITIYELKILKINLPFVSFYIHCSKGTYVRKVAEDIGRFLGCGAHIIKIKRLSVGHFKIEDAIALENINENHLQSFTC